MTDADREEPKKLILEPEKMKARAEIAARAAAIGDTERSEPHNPSARAAESIGPWGGSPKAPHGGKQKPQSGFQRAVGIIRTVGPVLQKVLPLLDGNVASAVSNFLVPRVETQRVDLEPIENALTKMRKEHVDLRINLADQTATLKRVAEQVETVKDTAERNALEQKELGTDLQRLRAKVNAFAWVGLGLLTISILVNVLLFWRIQQLIH
jgi:hypothetical protein